MRIDFLITELNVGGAEKALTELAIGMQQREHEVRVISIGSQPPQGRRRLADRLADQGIEVAFGGFDHFRGLWSATRWLTEHLRSDPPEICQTFLYHANCLGALAAKRAGVETVVGGLRVAQRNRVRLLIEKRAVRRMCHVTCVSDQVRTFALKHLSADPHKYSVIPNGVDVATYRDAVAVDWSQIGWPSDSRVALFVGRLHPQKGIELIQQAFDRLFPRGSGRRLVLVGDGPLRESLCVWAESVGSDRVQILPWQNQIEQYIKAARLLVLPSHYEGMPNVVLEAMAAGRPVVCSRVEGSRELLGNETAAGGASQRSDRQGFSPGDANEMAQRIEAFFADDSLGESIGIANQRHVETEFSNRKMIERYQSLYQSLLSD